MLVGIGEIMKKKSFIVGGLATIALALGAVVLPAAPAFAGSCSAYAVSTLTPQYGASSICSAGMISVQHRAFVTCSDGTQRVSAWKASNQVATAWCPVGRTRTGYWNYWEIAV